MQADFVIAVQDAFWQLAEALMMHHTNPWELDEALEAFGYGTGPCEAQDHLGLVQVLARQPRRTHPVLPRMVAEGRMGKIGGVGYYRYPGGGGAVIDPLIEDLILEEAWFAKVMRSELPPEDLVARMNSGLAAFCQKFPARSDWGEVLAEAVHFPAHRIGALEV